MEYKLIKSFVSSKIIVGRSKTHGMGMHAVEPIQRDEIVFIKGGHILTKDQLYYSNIINSYIPIDDNFFIGALNQEEEESVKLYINHSCEPNCGLRGEITFVATRDIEIGEELYCDYAVIDDEEYSFDCSCNTKSCRKIITGRDWRILDLQERYFGYFAVYLQKKINELGNDN